MAGDTVGEWADRAAQLPAVLVRTTPDAVRSGAQVLEAASRSKLLAVSGGDLKLSRVRSGKGAAVNVRVVLRGSGSKTQALVLPVGPVSLVERNTARHRQPFQYVGQRTGGAKSYSMARRRKAARNGRGLIYVPGLGMFQGVNHPGTKGQRPIGRAWDETHAEAGQAGVDVFLAAIRTQLTN